MTLCDLLMAAPVKSPSSVRSDIPYASPHHYICQLQDAGWIQRLIHASDVHDGFFIMMIPRACDDDAT